jgi:hypothetical protein
LHSRDRSFPSYLPDQSSSFAFDQDAGNSTSRGHPKLQAAIPYLTVGPHLPAIFVANKRHHLNPGEPLVTKSLPSIWLRRVPRMFPLLPPVGAAPSMAP